MWGTDVDVSGLAYSKLSFKNWHVAISHLALYDLSGLCLGYTPAAWAGAPDKVRKFPKYQMKDLPLPRFLCNGIYLSLRQFSHPGRFVMVNTPEWDSWTGGFL